MAFTTLTHTHSHTTIITFSSVKKKILGRFCFSFKGGELRGRVLSSRRGPTGDRKWGQAWRVRGIPCSLRGWGETCTHQGQESPAQWRQSQKSLIYSERQNAITKGTGKIGGGPEKAKNREVTEVTFAPTVTHHLLVPWRCGDLGG